MRALHRVVSCRCTVVIFEEIVLRLSGSSDLSLDDLNRLLYKSHVESVLCLLSCSTDPQLDRSTSRKTVTQPCMSPPKRIKSSQPSSSIFVVSIRPFQMLKAGPPLPSSCPVQSNRRTLFRSQRPLFSVFNRSPPHHTNDIHFMIPEVAGQNTMIDSRRQRAILQRHSDAVFERLVQDVYDDVDRPIVAVEWGTAPPYHLGNHQHVAALLPPNEKLTATRNQKLAKFDNHAFSIFIIDILKEIRRRFLGESIPVKPPIPNRTYLENAGMSVGADYGNQDYDEVADCVWLYVDKRTIAHYKEKADMRRRMTTGGISTEFHNTLAEEVLCPNLFRVGRIGDGGKWMCGPQFIADWKKKCVIYSFGINRDTSFETEIHGITQGKCDIIAVDKNRYDAPAKTLNSIGAQYIETKIATNTTSTTTTVSDLMKRFGHKHIDVLKMDIEWGEYEVADDIFDLQICQMMVELHSNPGDYGIITEWLKKASAAGYYLIHHEVNVSFMNCVEVTLLHEKCFERFGNVVVLASYVVPSNGYSKVFATPLALLPLSVIELVSVSVVGGAMTNLILERLVATIWINVYECWKSYTFVVGINLLVSCVWASLVGLVILIDDGFLYALMIICFLHIIMVIAIGFIEYKNHKLYKIRVSTQTRMTLSQRYQLSENLKVMKFLRVLLVTEVICNLSDVVAFFVYFIADNFWIKLFFHYVWQWIAFFFAAVIMGIFMVNGALPTLKQWYKWLNHNRVGDQSRTQETLIKSTLGKQMVFHNHQEADIYFKQFASSWK
uniref:Methyltranfer_dom domain-containing protein n=1 Tax=Panagrellus redivivus TaxID=6233 RepID=A0A7E4ZZI0_PANRE